MPQKPESSADFANHLDDALAALWEGKADPLDEILDEKGSGAPGVGEIFAPASSSPDAISIPSQIGPFQILRELGRGGMGIVYEAKQRHPDRLVALKVIRGGQHLDDQRVKLFQREVQTLARLKHPDIAALYEAGQTPDGQHFFAMELIAGVPLTEYVPSHASSSASQTVTLQEQMDVFCRVCDAINYAHQRGVIHRDIKPSNILVARSDDSDSRSGRRGTTVKVLDFGLARVTDPDVAALTVTTDTSRIKGTLPYMSPEQVQGDPADIDTRTDVYALGVVLYQMLTGQLPIDPRRRSMSEAIQAVRDLQPPRPSTINKSLDGDLETIVLKAIEKDRDRRYQSAAALSDDIHRFLARQPILARPPSTLYQLKKLIARHKLAVTAGVAVLMVSITAAIVSTGLYFEAQAAKRTAQQQQYIAENINAFLVKTLSSTDPRKAQGRDTSLLRDIVDSASARIDSQLDGEPLIQAALDLVVGRVYLSLGLYGQAETHMVRSLNSRRVHLGKEHEETLESANGLAVLLGDQGKYEEAIALHTETYETRLRVLGEMHPDTLNSMNDLGDLYRDRTQVSKGKPLLQKALRLRREVLGDKHPDTLLSINNLASVFLFERKFSQAERLLRESLAGQLETLPENHIDVLISKNDLALALNRQGKYDEAEPLFQSVYAGFQQQLGEGHLDTLIVGYNITGLLDSKGELEQAGQWLQRLLVTAEQSLPQSHYLPGLIRSTLARNLLKRGRPADALPLAEQSMEELNSRLSDRHPYTRSAKDILRDIQVALQED